MEIAERLSSHFQEQQHHAPPPGLGADAVAAWGIRHRRRRAVGATVAAIAVVAVGGLGALTLRSIADDATPDQAAPTIASDAAVAGVVGESTLAWETYEGTLGSFDDDVVASNGVFYALSTAPGARHSDGVSPVPQALYHSTDGVTWTSELLGNDLHADALAARDGVVYLVSTMPAVSATGGEAIGARVASSHDDGASWTTADLPMADTPPAGPWSVAASSTTAHIAAGESGVVVAVNADFWFDYSDLVPDEYRGPNLEVQRTDTGLQVLDYTSLLNLEVECSDAMAAIDAGTASELSEDCRLLQQGEFDTAEYVVYEATWDELGVSDPGRGTFAALFFSDDGTAFEAVDTPFAPGARIAALYATDSGFLAFEGSPESQPLRAWRSADGRTWERVHVHPLLTNVAAVGMVDDRIVLVGDWQDASDHGPLVLSSADEGVTWTEIDLTTAIPGTLRIAASVQYAAVGPTGVVATLWLRQDTPSDSSSSSMGVLHSTDLATWSLTLITALDPEGAGSDYGWVNGVVAGANRVIINQHNPGLVPSSTVRIGTPID